MRPPALRLLAAFLTAAGAGCNESHTHQVAVLSLSGVSASDFRTLADYLSDPAVQSIFGFMPRHAGSSPPNVEGRYVSTGTVTASSVAGSAVGSAVSSGFCLGPPAGPAIEVAVLDSTAVDAGALSFIEGAGDLFTVYTAFKSVQAGPSGATCEIHEVLVFSGRREADGSLSSLFIGLGIVGLLGDCGALAVDQIQVSQNTASRSGASCVGGATPANPARVLVEVDNFLVTDTDVFVNGSLVGTAPLLSSLIFESDPGFTLSFQSVPPLNGSGVALGETLAGVFPADAQPAGRFSQYGIGNQVGDDIYFAPTVENHTGTNLTVKVNVGTPLESDCGCLLASAPLAQYVVGYHFYDAPGVIAASETSVQVDEVPQVNPPTLFPGPFDLGLDSGVVSFLFP